MDRDIVSYAVSADAMEQRTEFDAAQISLDEIVGDLVTFKADMAFSRASNIRPVVARLEEVHLKYYIHLDVVQYLESFKTSAGES
jgi:hypothetical protein